MVFALAGDSTITRALSLRARTAGGASLTLALGDLPFADFLAAGSILGAAFAVRAALPGFSAFSTLSALSALAALSTLAAAAFLIAT